MIAIFKPAIFRRFLPAAFILLVAVPSLQAQKVTQIEILNADIIRTDKSLGPGAQKLLGNVMFKHEEAIMTCDSAYFYSKTYSMDAFSNVEIVQGDTLFLYGDKLHYEGETKLAQVRQNVKLINDSTVLVTDYLDYNRVTEIAYYLNGGVITEGDNRLTSEQGYYNTNTEVFNFKDSVVIVNPDYNIYSDTLEYNTKTGISYFFGPTEIIGEENYLYCESGWYDTDKDISLLNKNAYLENESRILRGDTLYYDRNTGFGRARSNVELFDSTQNVILRGNYGIYYEEKQLATLTDSALMIQVDGPDSLFIHADTLRSIADTSSLTDTKILLAYYKVKIYRHDIQGMCDSLAYIEKDSIFHLYGTPIIWADENQITATKIELKTRNEQLHRIFLRDIALLISQEDTAKYNQIRGKSMTGYFRNNDLVRMDVTGNGQTIYYAEDQGIIIGVNRAECSDLIIYLEDNKVKKVNYLVQPSGQYYPLDMFPENQRKLDGFSWNEEWRPLRFSDVYIWK
ncbi:MAG: OstA-like protein [Bacteroidales bacterium]|nr:OstA-like protein [Bacteroidales bacterium]MDT8432531.1 OstA-like protein [Bacteroidales bacterium]